MNQYVREVVLSTVMQKQAEERSMARRAVLMKAAGVLSDVVAAATPGVVLGGTGFAPAAALSDRIGNIAGLVADPEGDLNPATRGSSFIPGVGAYRLAQRKRRVADASNAKGAHGTANLVAELLGKYTSSAVGGVAGGLLGKRLGGDKRHAAIGAVTGAVAPLILGSLGAAISSKRTKDEQVERDSAGRAVAKYLIPGLATYDNYKRLGASSNYDEKQK